MDDLRVLRPTTFLRVSENIPDILSFIQQILNNHHAYITKDGVFFDTQSFNTYGKLAPRAEINSEV